ncbi:MAG: KpsF/GutQ family sugar-phosphate isomerase [Xanthomonadales bacterium]|nr:KpsF/GutQ family sugar-phosphate isomerase [Xanthomonadales bacterium]
MGRYVINTEKRSVADLEARIDATFVDACRHMLECKGRIVVLGMGKSGHVASKIAATLASTGSPAFFVHPGEASHGDLGMITAHDVVLALSNSGETDEILTILPVIKRLDVPLIVLTGRRSSTLARNATVHIDVSVAEEACPLGLAPTSSTTAALAMGDALAISLLQARGFTTEEFARSHPAGQLGRRLLLHISDIMHRDGGIPKVHEGVSLKDAIMEMTLKGLGMTAVVDDGGRLLGVFTDGDLRRTLDGKHDIEQTRVSDVMTRNGKTIGPGALAFEAAQLMEEFKIHSLLVVDGEDRLVGALNIHDLLRARVV